jgi:hypothetical protein
MAKRFSKRVVRKVKKILKPDETRDVIEKEFGDTRGNKTILQFDFRPHSINKPTVEIEYDYGEDK